LRRGEKILPLELNSAILCRREKYCDWNLRVKYCADLKKYCDWNLAVQYCEEVKNIAIVTEQCDIAQK